MKIYLACRTDVWAWDVPLGVFDSKKAAQQCCDNDVGHTHLDVIEAELNVPLEAPCRPLT